VPSRDLRCFCSARPLLAKWGADEKGGFIHVKVYKGRQIMAEMVCRGTVSLRCRFCFRWHRVVIGRDGSSLRTTRKPLELTDE
jgi:hypothetical protein